MQDTYLIQTAASIVGGLHLTLDRPSARRQIAAAERKRRKKAKALARASKKRNRK